MLAALGELFMDKQRIDSGPAPERSKWGWGVQRKAKREEMGWDR